jgi:hypothetical protein
MAPTLAVKFHEIPKAILDSSTIRPSLQVIPNGGRATRKFGAGEPSDRSRLQEGRQVRLFAFGTLRFPRRHLAALSHYSKGSVQLCLGNLAARRQFANSEVRQALYDRLTAMVGPLSTKTLTGFPGFPVTKLTDPAIRAGFAQLLRYICFDPLHRHHPTQALGRGARLRGAGAARHNGCRSEPP